MQSLPSDIEGSSTEAAIAVNTHTCHSAFGEFGTALQMRLVPLQRVCFPDHLPQGCTVADRPSTATLHPLLHVTSMKACEAR